MTKCPYDQMLAVCTIFLFFRPECPSHICPKVQLISTSCPKVNVTRRICRFDRLLGEKVNATDSIAPWVLCTNVQISVIKKHLTAPLRRGSEFSGSSVFNAESQYGRGSFEQPGKYKKENGRQPCPLWRRNSGIETFSDAVGQPSQNHAARGGTLHPAPRETARQDAQSVRFELQG